MIEEINVATYAWAIRAIYGRNQKVVTELRHLIKRNRRRLARYPRVDPRAQIPGTPLDTEWAKQAARRSATLPPHMWPAWLRAAA
jgi:hypothetical protein